MSFIKTFVFMDLETTGLPTYNNSTKITEMNMIAVRRNHLTSAEIPRVLNKLNLCFTPLKLIHPTVTNLTGLDNYLLEDIKPFSDITFNLLDNFLQHQQSPVCLVAHNGYNFDFPILKSELNRIKKELSDDILCIDSLPAFKHIFSKVKPSDASDDLIEMEMNDEVDADLVMVTERVEATEIVDKTEIKEAINYQQLINEITPRKQITSKSVNYLPGHKSGRQSNIFVRDQNYKPKAKRRLIFDDDKKPESFSLKSLYSFIIQKQLTNAHQAEVDTYALMKCCGAVHEEFFKYADENCKAFNQITGL